MERDRFGLRRLFHRPGGAAATSLRALVEPGDGLDPEGVAFALGEQLATARTWIAGIHRVPAGHRLEGEPGAWRITPAAYAEDHDPRRLEERLLAALDRALSIGKKAALALSGGLDSALLLALLASSFRRQMPALYVLAPRLPGGDAYDESAAAVELARSLDLQAIVVEASERDFVEALPGAIAAVEAPLYNLHPVAKHLLFTRMAADGVRLALTGDGADQAFSGAPAEIYLPLVGALAEASGVELACPFLDDAVVASAGPPDRDKRALRSIARGKLPAALVDAPKVARLAPPLDLSRHEDRPRTERLAAALHRAPGLEGDRLRTGLITLALACDALGVRV